MHALLRRQIKRYCGGQQHPEEMARLFEAVSPQACARHDLVHGLLERSLERYGIRPELLSIEITESTAMNEPQETLQVLRGLQACGVQSAIDDFGSGYSSLSYLKQLPAYTLKIDRSFVRDLSTDPNDCDIAKSMVDLSHSLSMKITAEGVESEAQLGILREMGCDQVQGWLFAKAAPAAQTAEFLVAATPLEQSPRVRPDLKLV